MANLPALFASLENQTFKDFVVRVVDNGSNDGLEKWLREKYPQVMLIRHSRNLGFTAAHNQMIKYAIDKWPGENLAHCYVLVISPDVVLTKNCLEKLVATAEVNKEAGAFTPKVLKMFQDDFGDEVLKEDIHSDIIDNTGLRTDRGRRFHQRGAGELDKGQYDGKAAQEIFGVNNVVALYRASSLESVKLKDGEYFDEDFYAYKEDADLAWRLRWAGWSARLVAEAVAHHARGSSKLPRKNIFTKINQRRHSRIKNFYHTRNHWWVLIKNLSWWDLGLFWPWIFWAALGRIIYTSIFEPRNLSAFFATLGSLPKMFRKRREVFARRKAIRKTLSRWFS